MHILHHEELMWEDPEHMGDLLGHWSWLEGSDSRSSWHLLKWRGFFLYNMPV